MSDSQKDPDSMIEVTCPMCRAKVTIKTKDAERTMKVSCPKGHEIPLMKAL